MARAFKGVPKKAALAPDAKAAARFDAPFDPVIPCRVASPQSSTPFHQAAGSITGIEDEERSASWALFRYG
jgi:hypothetical protein